MKNIQLDIMALDRIRKISPLIHHLTNTVTVNDCANITLALGASPAMTEDALDGTALVEHAGALVINMGTPTSSNLEMMISVGKQAKRLGIPVIFDPVAAGATPMRSAGAFKILREVKPDIVKGNGAEIKFLAGESSRQRGVDSLETHGIPEAAAALAREYSLIAVATGESDVVSDGSQTFMINGGHPYMSRITGSGCMAASIQGGFAAVTDSRLEGALLGVLAMNKAGESAFASLLPGEGTGHYRTRLIDAISLLTPQDLTFQERLSHV